MTMEKWKIKFTLQDTPVQFRYEAENKTVWDAVYADGMLQVTMLFTVDPRPLVLTAPANAGDEILFTYRPYRLELFVNSVLMDEEWPWGENYLDSAMQTAANVVVSPNELTEPPELPSFCGGFENAEGWCPGNGVSVGDCMPYVHEDRFHVLYLWDRRHHASKWGRGGHQWAHISTADFKHWDIHPMAVEVDDPAEGAICTGSHIYHNGQHWLYYTVRQSDLSARPVLRSISEDGYHYRKDKSFCRFLSNRYRGLTDRDPQVVLGDDGLLHMFVTTTDLTIPHGCLAHLTSPDGVNWTEQPENLINWQRPIPNAPNVEPECPYYCKMGDYYYLVHDGMYAYSRKPYSDWVHPENSRIPCGSVPKGAFWQGRLIFVGFEGHGKYAGTMTFLEATQNPDGTLSFHSLKTD